MRRGSARRISGDGRADPARWNRLRRSVLLLTLSLVVALAACAPATLAPTAGSVAWTSRQAESPTALQAEFARAARRAGWTPVAPGPDGRSRATLRVERCGWLGIGTYIDTLRAELAVAPLDTGGTDAGGTLVTLTLDLASESAALGASVRDALGGTWTPTAEPRRPAGRRSPIGGPPRS